MKEVTENYRGFLKLDSKEVILKTTRKNKHKQTNKQTNINMNKTNQTKMNKINQQK